MSNVYGAVRFTASKSGKTGLTVAGMVDVYQITKASGASSQVVTDGNAVEIGQGMYGYVYGSADTATYLYLAVFTTADTSVDDKQPAVWMADLAEGAALAVAQADLDNPSQYKADVSALALETTAQAILADTGTDGVVVATASKTGYSLSAAGVQAIWDALSSALTTVGSIGKRIVDYITGDIFARLGAPAGASVSADIATVDTVVDAIKAKTDLITTNTSISVNSALDAGALTIYAGKTFLPSSPFTGLSIPAAWKYIDFQIKNVATDADTAALIWIRATNPAAGTDGLQRLNGATATAAQGSLTVDQAAGTIAVWIADEVTAQLTATTSVYGLKYIDTSGDSDQLCSDGTCTISNMVVKALT